MKKIHIWVSSGVGVFLCVHGAYARDAVTSTVVTQEVRNDAAVPLSDQAIGNGYFAGFSITLPLPHVQQESSGVVPLPSVETRAMEEGADHGMQQPTFPNPSPVFFVPTHPRTTRSAYTDDVGTRIVERAASTSNADSEKMALPQWKTYTDVVLYGMKPSETDGYTDVPERVWRDDALVTFAYIPSYMRVPVRSVFISSVVAFVSHGQVHTVGIHNPYPDALLPVDLVGFTAYSGATLLLAYFSLYRLFLHLL